MKHLLISLLCLGALPALAQNSSLAIRSGINYNYNFLAQHFYDARHWGGNAELAFRHQVHPRLVFDAALSLHSFRASELRNFLLVHGSGNRRTQALMLSVPVSAQTRIGPERKLRFYAGLLLMTTVASVKDEYTDGNWLHTTTTYTRLRIIPGLSQTTTYYLSPRLEGQFVCRLLRSFGTKDRGFLSLPEDPQTLLGMQLGLAYRF